MRASILFLDSWITSFAFLGAAGHALSLGTAAAAIVSDMKSFRIPDPIVAIGSFLALAGVAILDPRTLGFRLFASGSAFFCLYILSLAMRAGLGLGDIKILSLSAFCIGPIGLWIVLMAASGSGLIFWLIRRAARGKTRGSDERIAFMPFIAFGLAVSFIASIV